MSLRKLGLSLIAVLSFATITGWNARAAEPAKADAPAAGATAIPKNHPFAKIHEGMTPEEVGKILGEPTGRHEYPTAKNWIPFYHGSDTWRSEWLYKGKGSIVFTHNRYSGSTTVLEVLYNPAQD